MKIHTKRYVGLSSLLLATALLIPSWVRASDCEPSLPNVRIEGGSTFERTSACEGLKRATKFFQYFGFESKTDLEPIVYQFQEVVRTPCQEEQGTQCTPIRVAGMYNGETKTITMTSISQAWMKLPKRTYFKMRYNNELYVSVLAHEAAHALSKQFYQKPPTTHAQDEYIAYASQLWSMESSTRDKIFSLYPEDKYVFAHELNINDIVHFSEPHAFGVMSYRHFSSPVGGKTMLTRIYNGDYQAPTMDMP